MLYAVQKISYIGLYMNSRVIEFEGYTGFVSKRMSSWDEANTCRKSLLLQVSTSVTSGVNIVKFMRGLKVTTMWINLMYSSHYRWNNGTSYGTEFDITSKLNTYTKSPECVDIICCTS